MHLSLNWIVLLFVMSHRFNYSLLLIHIMGRIERVTLRWRHNERDCVSNHQPYDYLLNRLFRYRLKKTSKLRVTGLWEGNSPGTGEFPARRASNAEIVSIWWRHHEIAIHDMGMQALRMARIDFMFLVDVFRPHVDILYIDGFMLNCNISIALALEIL